MHHGRLPARASCSGVYKPSGRLSPMPRSLPCSWTESGLEGYRRGRDRDRSPGPGPSRSFCSHYYSQRRDGPCWYSYESHDVVDDGLGHSQERINRKKRPKSRQRPDLRMPCRRGSDIGPDLLFPCRRGSDLGLDPVVSYSGGSGRRFHPVDPHSAEARLGRPRKVAFDDLRQNSSMDMKKLFLQNDELQRKLAQLKKLNADLKTRASQWQDRVRKLTAPLASRALHHLHLPSDVIRTYRDHRYASPRLLPGSRYVTECLQTGSRYVTDGLQTGSRYVTDGLQTGSRTSCSELLCAKGWGTISTQTVDEPVIRSDLPGQCPWSTSTPDSQTALNSDWVNARHRRCDHSTFQRLHVPERVRRSAGAAGGCLDDEGRKRNEKHHVTIASRTVDRDRWVGDTSGPISRRFAGDSASGLIFRDDDEDILCMHHNERPRLSKRVGRPSHTEQSTTSRSGDPGERSRSSDSGERSRSGDSGESSRSGDPGERSRSSDSGERSRSGDPGESSRSSQWRGRSVLRKYDDRSNFDEKYGISPLCDVKSQEHLQSYCCSKHSWHSICPSARPRTQGTRMLHHVHSSSQRTTIPHQVHSSTQRNSIPHHVHSSSQRTSIPHHVYYSSRRTSIPHDANSSSQRTSIPHHVHSNTQRNLQRAHSCHDRSLCLLGSNGADTGSVWGQELGKGHRPEGHCYRHGALHTSHSSQLLCAKLKHHCYQDMPRDSSASRQNRCSFYDHGQLRSGEDCQCDSFTQRPWCRLTSTRQRYSTPHKEVSCDSAQSRFNEHDHDMVSYDQALTVSRSITSLRCPSIAWRTAHTAHVACLQDKAYRDPCCLPHRPRLPFIPRWKQISHNNLASCQPVCAGALPPSALFPHCRPHNPRFPAIAPPSVTLPETSLSRHHCPVRRVRDMLSSRAFTILVNDLPVDCRQSSTGVDPQHSMNTMTADVLYYTVDSHADLSMFNTRTALVPLCLPVHHTNDQTTQAAVVHHCRSVYGTERGTGHFPVVKEQHLPPGHWNTEATSGHPWHRNTETTSRECQRLQSTWRMCSYDNCRQHREIVQHHFFSTRHSPECTDPARDIRCPRHSPEPADELAERDVHDETYVVYKMDSGLAHDLAAHNTRTGRLGQHRDGQHSTSTDNTQPARYEVVEKMDYTKNAGLFHPRNKTPGIFKESISSTKDNEQNLTEPYRQYDVMVPEDNGSKDTEEMRQLPTEDTQDMINATHSPLSPEETHEHVSEEAEDHSCSEKSFSSNDSVCGETFSTEVVSNGLVTPKKIACEENEHQMHVSEEESSSSSKSSCNEVFSKESALHTEETAVQQTPARRALYKYLDKIAAESVLWYSCEVTHQKVCLQITDTRHQRHVTEILLPFLQDNRETAVPYHPRITRSRFVRSGHVRFVTISTPESRKLEQNDKHSQGKFRRNNDDISIETKQTEISHKSKDLKGMVISHNKFMTNKRQWFNKYSVYSFTEGLVIAPPAEDTGHNPTSVAAQWADIKSDHDINNSNRNGYLPPDRDMKSDHDINNSNCNGYLQIQT